MYASIRHYQFKPGKAAEVSKKAQEGFLPIISKASGFIAYYIVMEGNDMGTSISIFDSQAQAEASSQLAADYIKQNMAELYAGPPTVTSGEITVHKTV